ncbi:NAD(P)-dependent oxidoreductase [Ferrovibrio sp.]|uniref:NAD-dependent epimerase/dehydratase family protein n=1 Tax=Ferrovibrio sp. TaxID=1917215 RepID=UPI0025C737E8|nr:NAD(P)-dependent oxidoreductase [Ferrovibrio sp.]MBX3454242.1 NAD(P)-dependent oxidoreductase [Ferrovibrio sp.]
MLTHHREATGAQLPRVVVIGARGFIGRALCRRLTAAGMSHLPLTSAEIDLTKAEAGAALAGVLREGDAVVLLSALTPDKGRDRATFMRNIAMADAVCGAIEMKTPSHVVYVSSDAVYPFDNGLVSEQSPAISTDLYSAMHLARETLLRQAAAKIPYAVLRPTMVYGAGDTHNSYGPNRFRRQAVKDGKITLGGAGEETRDHIAVDDAAALIQLVLQHTSDGVLNLATGHSPSFDDVARLVAGHFSPPVPVVHTPRQSPITYRRFDITALHKAFPDFRFTSLEDGLATAHSVEAGAAASQ